MNDIVCPRCGAVNEYNTTKSGPHTRADCSRCGKYIKFIPKADVLTAIHTDGTMKQIEYEFQLWLEQCNECGLKRDQILSIINKKIKIEK